MKLVKALAAGTALAAIVAPATATKITYSYSSTFTGLAGSTPFELPITFTGIGDTADVGTVPGSFSYVPLSSLTGFAGISFTVTQPVVFGFVPAGGIAAFLSSETNAFAFSSPALVGYDGVSNITATTKGEFTSVTFTTNFGNLVLTDQGEGEFSAVLGVPEPASWAMMVGGFGVIGAGLRRRRRMIVSFG